MNDALRETMILLRAEARQLVRSRLFAAVLLVYAAGALLAGVFFSSVVLPAYEKIEVFFQQSGDKAAGAATDTFYKLLVLFSGGDWSDAARLAEEHVPALVLFFVFGARWFVPPMLMLAVPGPVGGELFDRRARWPLVRARRGSWLAAKLLAQLAAYALVTAATWLVVYLYATLRVPEFYAGPAAIHLARFWAEMLVFGACYTALAGLIAVFFQPAVAPVAGLFSLLVLGIVARVTAFEAIAWLSPSHFEPRLVASGQTLWLALGAYALFAGLLSGAAYALVRRRDL